MKGKQLAILLLVVLVLGGLWYLAGGLRNGVWSETGSGGGNKVVEFPLNDVTQVVIKNSTGDLHLVKKSDQWTVQERAGYPANFELVSGFLRKLWELKRLQVVKVGPSQLPRLDLADPGKDKDKDAKGTGTEVELLGADGKPYAAVLLGKKYLRKSAGGGEMDFGGMGGADGVPAGRYVKRVGGETVSLVSETFSDANPKPASWLSKDFVKITDPKMITLAGTTDSRHWSISRNGASEPWTLAGAKPDEAVDASKATSLIGTLPAMSFNDVLAPDDKIDEPVTTATIETFDGFRYELRIGPVRDDSYPVRIAVSASFPKERVAGKDEKPEDKKRLDEEFTTKQKQLADKLAAEKAFEGRPYLISKYTIDAFVKDRNDLLSVKPAATPAPTPAGGTIPAPATAIPAAAPTISPITVVTPALTVPLPQVQPATSPVSVAPLPTIPPTPVASPSVTLPVSAAPLSPSPTP